MSSIEAAVTALADHLRQRKDHPDQPLELEPYRELDRASVEQYFMSLRTTTDDDRRMKTFLQQTFDGNMHFVPASDAFKSFHGEVHGPRFSELLSVPGGLWGYLWQRASIGFRCAEGLWLLPFVLYELDSSASHEIKMARLVLWEAIAVRQAPVCQDAGATSVHDVWVYYMTGYARMFKHPVNYQVSGCFASDFYNHGATTATLFSEYNALLSAHRAPEQ